MSERCCIRRRGVGGGRRRRCGMGAAALSAMPLLSLHEQGRWEEGIALEAASVRMLHLHRQTGHGIWVHACFGWTTRICMRASPPHVAHCAPRRRTCAGACPRRTSRSVRSGTTSPKWCDAGAIIREQAWWSWVSGAAAITASAMARVPFTSNDGRAHHRRACMRRRMPNRFAA